MGGIWKKTVTIYFLQTVESNHLGNRGDLWLRGKEGFSLERKTFFLFTQCILCDQQVGESSGVVIGLMPPPPPAKCIILRQGDIERRGQPDGAQDGGFLGMLEVS